VKILQINSVYGNGSTGKIVESNSRILRSMGHDVLTLYGNKPDLNDGFSKRVCGKMEHNINAVLSRLNGIPFGGIFLSNGKAYHEIEDFKPDIIHIHCINGLCFNIYKLLKNIASLNIKTVVTLHAEFFHTGSCSHACECEQWKTECKKCDNYKYETASLFFNRAHRSWRLMREAFSTFDKKNLIITAVSPWLASRARQSVILRNLNVCYVPNGVNTHIFKYNPDARIPSKFIVDGKQNVLFVTPKFTLLEGHLKGGYFLPEIARKMPSVNFIVVASTIEGNIAVLPENIKVYGRAESQEKLADLYSASNVTLLLSRRETFSMVTAESLCCGTPVVGFKSGGPETIAIPDFSCFVDYGDINALVLNISKLLNTSVDKAAISAKADIAYAENTMSHYFEKIYQKLYD